MKVNLAEHYGMCFGVRDAIQATGELAESGRATVLGQLVHNPVVDERLEALGVSRGELEDVGEVSTPSVVITAHGAAESIKARWREAGYAVTDTTCPLVHRAHRALERLVNEGYTPVVIGKAGHVEVNGLTRDYPETIVLLEEAEVDGLPFSPRIGVVSQTTQPLARVQVLVERIRARHPAAEVKFVDTVCQPTKDRQRALEKLCVENDTVVAVGGWNSNNTRQLVETARIRGCRAYQVEGPDDLQAEWFADSESVGVTAGTSTLPETVAAVVQRLRDVAGQDAGES